MESNSDWSQLAPGLEKKVIQAGIRGNRPRFWSEVEISVDGTPSPEPLLPSGDCTKVCIGLSLDESSRTLHTALQLMDEGEVSHFRAKKSDDSWTIFKLHLLRIIELKPPLDCWDSEEVQRVAGQLKDQGISLFREKRIVDSFHLFSRSLKLVLPLEVRLKTPKSVETNIDFEREIRQFVSSLYNNLAACQLEKKNYASALYLCDQVLERNPNEVKAIYRKATALNGNFFRISQI